MSTALSSLLPYFIFFSLILPFFFFCLLLFQVSPLVLSAFTDLPFPPLFIPFITYSMPLCLPCLSFPLSTSSSPPIIFVINSFPFSVFLANLFTSFYLWVFFFLFTTFIFYLYPSPVSLTSLYLSAQFTSTI